MQGVAHERADLRDDDRVEQQVDPRDEEAGLAAERAADVRVVGARRRHVLRELREHDAEHQGDHEGARAYASGAATPAFEAMKGIVEQARDRRRDRGDALHQDARQPDRARLEGRLRHRVLFPRRGAVRPTAPPSSFSHVRNGLTVPRLRAELRAPREALLTWISTRIRSVRSHQR